MPKDRRVNSSSCDRARLCPYSCSSRISDHNNSNSSSPQVGDEKEWEEARCTICMEHPHNALLLLCSSREKGCRPFICDTSYRHSNCFDQFRKSAAASSLSTPLEEERCELVCPLCRGLVTGWDVIQHAREFMNSKTRSCSLETCSFSGNYSELRKHARLEHPFERPSEASPTRQSNWTTLEQQMDIEDALAHQSDIEYDFDGWPSWDDLGEDDLHWSDESFFDFPIAMPDIEDEMIDELFSGLSSSFFSLYSSSPDEEMADSGSSRSSERNQRTALLTNSDSRPDNHVGNSFPNSRSRPSYHSEDGAAVSRSRTDYRRENDATNLRSRSSYHIENGSTNASSRSGYHRQNVPSSFRTRPSFPRVNGSAVSRSRSSYPRENGSAVSRSRSSYPRENGSAVSRSRSSYPRENGSAVSRSRSSYPRENGSAVSWSRSSYQRENATANSRTRSSYYREYDRPSSRARSRFYRREANPTVRGYTTRHSPGSSRQPNSSYWRRGE